VLALRVLPLRQVYSFGVEPVDDGVEWETTLAQDQSTIDAARADRRPDLELARCCAVSWRGCRTQQRGH
jgi:hypothetical protein